MFSNIAKKIHSKTKSITWLTKGIRIASEKKRYLRFLSYKTKSSSSKLAYRHYNKLFKKCIVTAQRLYNESYINKATNIM